MSCPILWQNKDKTVTLIDIPRSIAAAQGTAEKSCTDALLSSEPLQDPFPSTDPKSADGKGRLTGNAAHDVLHEKYQRLLGQALVEARAFHHAEWCLKRTVVSSPRRGPAGSSKKRKVTGEEHGSDADQFRAIDLPNTLLTSITKPCLNPPDFRAQPDDSTSTGEYDPGSSLWNANTQPATVTLTSHDITNGKSTDYNFRLPADSTFFLGDCSTPVAFHEVVRDQEQRFDFVLLDPPWPNRSVKRTHKTPGTSYSTIPTLEDIKALLLGLNIPALLSEKGYLGIWITNKPAIRDLVLNLFACCGVDLVQEWIWLKTTAKGEPVTPLEGTWNGRKPYEVLLIGRKRPAHILPKEGIKRRVLIGVPDLHSRKPCLKEMIEDLIGHDGKTLEVFARYLVSGWWSWGDECVKFNWNGFWRAESADHTVNGKRSGDIDDTTSRSMS
ncbi:putative DNA methylase, N-6 adenine-specific, S-adenosyl-L-methionine-dependent methyltransferase [Septoria linicola]|nr:putative DNA methylase, N-6 adenine-specific, S-adenosyl-L-methionine-dependent methyltransferase [Septoria linicola]